MKSFTNLSRMQLGIFILLIAVSGVLGYLFYDTYRTNIQDRELIKQTSSENLDLSQDLEIIKDKYDKLKTEVDVLKVKVTKVSYKKKNYKKKQISAAGKSSKYKKHHKKSNVNYKKLYFQLKKNCGVKTKKISRKNTYSRSSTNHKKHNTYSPPKSREYQRK
ncbi:MAG: hypothetical protein ABIY50_12875 [Ignavibacteria bacterium]